MQFLAGVFFAMVVLAPTEACRYALPLNSLHSSALREVGSVSGVLYVLSCVVLSCVVGAKRRCVNRHTVLLQVK